LLASGRDFGIASDDAMRHLGLSDATVSRQLREKHLPTIQTFLGVLVLVFKETRLSEARLPDYDSLIFEATRATIEQIRSNDFGLAELHLRQSQLMCVKLRSQRKQIISPNHLDELASVLAVHYPDENWDRHAVERTVEDWLDSYLAFKFGLEHILG
jgi:hypothetical protein